MRKGALALAAVLLAGAATASAQPGGWQPQVADNDVLQWNTAALDAVRRSRLGPPMVSRALAILHTCMYDAWAAFDDTAVGTRQGERARRPAVERTPENRRRAMNEAAYWAFVDVFPRHANLARDQMMRLGLEPTHSAPGRNPQGIGRTLCSSVLAFRHRDGANQLGDENNGAPYSDYTGYRPLNSLTTLRDPTHWQPVMSSNLGPSAFMAPHWGRVTPFAFRASPSTRPPAPPAYGGAVFRRDVEQLVQFSAALTDRDKAIVEFWMDGPNSETPPGHWNLLAQWVSRRDGHGVDEDVKLFFALNNALMDAGIATWDCKRHYDFVRPITAVRELYAGQRIRAWGGPFKGAEEMDGRRWLPFQRANFITPPFPEYVSGHSAFSAAAAEVLRRFTGSDDFGAWVVVAAGSSKVEPKACPQRELRLGWDTFTAAADEAGLSRRLGGIHFEHGDLEGRRLGRRVAEVVWLRALQYFGRQAAVPSGPTAGTFGGGHAARSAQ